MHKLQLIFVQLSACQKQFRQANLECILRLQRMDRAALFDAGEEEGAATRQRHPRGGDRATLLRETGRVTDNLSAISRKLAATVERSAMTVDDLAQSSTAVGETQEAFRNMGSVIGQSRKLINKYARRETTDAVLILFAFGLFFACVFYVLRKRVLGPLDPLSLTWNALTTLVNTLVNTVMMPLGNSRTWEDPAIASELKTIT